MEHPRPVHGVLGAGATRGGAARVVHGIARAEAMHGAARSIGAVGDAHRWRS